MARRKYIDSGDSRDNHMDSGVFLVPPSPSLNYSASYQGEDGDLKAREVNRVPSGKVVPWTDTYSKLELQEFSDDQLQEHFLMCVNSTRTKPIEYFESLLYSTTVDWIFSLHRAPVSLEAVNQLHHLEQLKRHEAELSPEEIQAVNVTRRRLATVNENWEKEYEIFEALLEICSGLIIKWGIFSENKYNHRTDARLLNRGILDLVEHCHTLFTLETYWLLSTATEEPLVTKLTEKAKTRIDPLIQQTFTVFSLLLSMNSEAINDKNASIDLYLASKSPEFAAMVNLKYSGRMEKPNFQEFMEPTKVCMCCRRRNRVESENVVTKLKAELTKMEETYYSFEEELYKSFLVSE